MKVFLSWSGYRSKLVAKSFANWIPKILPGTEFFFSPDVSKGDIWFQQIMSGIKSCDYGISFVTIENKENVWLQFESGALANNFDVARVTPVLCGLRNSQLENKNPLSKFQTCDVDHDGLAGLIRSIRQYINYPTLAYDAIDETVSRFEDELIAEVSEIVNESEDRQTDAGEVSEDSSTNMARVLSDLIEEVRSLSIKVSSGEKSNNSPNMNGNIEPSEFSKKGSLSSISLHDLSTLAPNDALITGRIVSKIESAKSFNELLQLRDYIHAYSLYLRADAQLHIKDVLSSALERLSENDE